MTRRALILDFGGVVSRTLFETHALTEQALGLPAGTLRWRGPFDPAGDPLWCDMQAGRLSERDYWLTRSREVGALVGERWETMAAFVQRARGADPDAVIRPEALVAIAAAKAAGCALALLSNELDLFYGEDFRARLPLLADMDVIVDATHTGILKPDPRAYADCLDQLGLPAAAAVFVDDQARNVDGAKRAGLTALAFDVTRPAASYPRGPERVEPAAARRPSRRPWMTTDTEPAGLGFAPLFAVAIGVIVAQSTIVSLLQAVGIAGWGFAGAMALGWLLMLANSATYAELALMMPRAEGISAYVRAGLGPWPAIFAVFAGYIVPALFGPAAELLLVDAVLDQLLPQALPAFGWAALLLGVLVVLNLRGTDVFARVQTVLTFAMLVFLVLTGAWALAGPTAVARHAGFGGMADGASVFGVVALVMYSLIGTEFVTPMTALARHPVRDVPRAMFVGLTVVALANALFCLGAVGVVGRETLATSALPHLDVALAVFGPGVKLVFAVVVITATASLINTVLAAVPRMLHDMARAGEAFPVFLRLNRHGVPWVATLFVAALPVVGLAWSGGDVGRIVPLLVAAASAWLVSYMVAHGALLALRRQAPDAPRPWRAPWAPWPQLAAIGALGWVIAHAAPAPEMEAPIFTALAVVLGLVAVVGALWVVGVLKRPAFGAQGLESAR